MLKGMRRFQNVALLRVKTVSEEFLEAVATHPGIKMMQCMGYVGYFHLYDTDPELLARAVINVEHMEFGKFRQIDMNQQHFEAVLAAVIEKGCKLKYLGIDRNNFSCDDLNIDPGLLAKALTRMEGLDLTAAVLSNDQWEALLLGMEEDSKLRTLRLSYSDLTGLTVRPEVFAKAINRLEKLEAWSLQFRPDYVVTLHYDG